ncbi:hypothetical protein ACLOJK_017216 [Asimina triloba]
MAQGRQICLWVACVEKMAGSAPYDRGSKIPIKGARENEIFQRLSSLGNSQPHPTTSTLRSAESGDSTIKSKERKKRRGNSPIKEDEEEEVKEARVLQEAQATSMKMWQKEEINLSLLEARAAKAVIVEDSSQKVATVARNDGNNKGSTIEHGLGRAKFSKRVVPNLQFKYSRTSKGRQGIKELLEDFNKEAKTKDILVKFMSRGSNSILSNAIKGIIVLPNIVEITLRNYLPNHWRKSRDLRD